MSLNRLRIFLHSKAIVIITFLIACIAISRFLAISHDPPRWMSADFFYDEGWWADSARGKVFFDDYFADDFGTGFLMTPGYTLLLRGIYSLFGVGIVQNRFVTCIASILIISIVSVTAWKKLGRIEALFCTVLLGISPLFWAYSRVAFVETLQTLFITAAFCIYMLKGQKILGALLSGLFIALSISIKMNATLIGFIPILIVAAFMAYTEIKQRNISSNNNRLLFLFNAFFWVFLGLVAGLGFFIFWVIIPFWKEFTTMAISESGVGIGSIMSKLTLIGTTMMSVDMMPGRILPKVWCLMRWSPAVFFGAWLSCLRFPSNSLKTVCKSAGRKNQFEIGAIAWMMSTLFFISLENHQPDRRFILMLPAMAFTATSFLFCRARENEITDKAYANDAFPYRRRLCSTFLLWFALSLPLFLVIKPICTLAIIKATTEFNIGTDPGVGHGAASTAITLGWLAILIPFSFFRSTSEKIKSFFLSKITSTVLLLVLILCEGIILGKSLIGSTNSVTMMQSTLRSIVTENETVLGHAAASVFSPIKVRTVRRTSDAEGTPPPNPDVWERTKPRYIIEFAEFNYEKLENRYQDLIVQKGYSFLSYFNVGPKRKGKWRFILELYERKQ